MLVIIKTIIVTRYGSKSNTFITTKLTSIVFGKMNKNPKRIEPNIAKSGFQTVNITNAKLNHPKD